eukprot:2781748-Rhodomonas_salina.1
MGRVKALSRGVRGVWTGGAARGVPDHRDAGGEQGGRKLPLRAREELLADRHPAAGDHHPAAHRLQRLAHRQPPLVRDRVPRAREPPRRLAPHLPRPLRDVPVLCQGGPDGFASTQHYRKLEGLQRGLPGVFFFYDLSPIKATFQESSSSFLHFLTGLCAIVGGVFTVAGMLDSTIYTGQRLAQKMQLGKQS